jgi:hypothetical protein
MTEPAMIAACQQAASGGPADELLDGLFGPTRRLYKRVAQYSYLEERHLYQRLARRPYPWLTECSGQMAEIMTAALGEPVADHEILFDAPPVQREVEFKVDVYYPKQDRYRPLGEVSPVVRTLALEQFDDYVKRVRIFAHPRIAVKLSSLDCLHQLVGQAIAQTERCESLPND